MSGAGIAGDQFARLSDGTHVRYQVHGQPDAPAMLIYNGLVSNAVHWRYWVPHFARRFAVVTWDYRGHGPGQLYGGKHAPGSISIEGFARDGHEVLAAAVGRRPAVVAAISMGVQAALEHVRRHPADVRGLILLCGTYGHPLDCLGGGAAGRFAAAVVARALFTAGPFASAAMLPFTGTALGRELAYLTGGAHRGFCAPDLLDELFRHVRRMQPHVIGQIVASYVGHSAEDMLGEVPVPTLIFAGADDQLTPPARAEVMAARIPDSELVVAPGHTHLLQVERPDFVHRHVSDWLARKGL